MAENPAEEPMKKIKKKRTYRMRKATDRSDITELMLEHHKPLKRLIKVMKNSELGMAKLKTAFLTFAPLLEGHAKPEELSLYRYMEREDSEIRQSGFEGQAEHEIADRLVQQIEKISDEDEWKAQVKVLAEIVEHHIEEEEEEMIPILVKELELKERVKIGEQYLEHRNHYFLESEAA
jgi:hemerythrin-like domain-containing protein